MIWAAFLIPSSAKLVNGTSATKMNFCRQKATDMLKVTYLHLLMRLSVLTVKESLQSLSQNSQFSQCFRHVQAKPGGLLVDDLGFDHISKAHVRI